MQTISPEKKLLIFVNQNASVKISSFLKNELADFKKIYDPDNKAAGYELNFRKYLFVKINNNEIISYFTHEDNSFLELVQKVNKVD